MDSLPSAPRALPSYRRTCTSSTVDRLSVATRGTIDRTIMQSWHTKFTKHWIMNAWWSITCTMKMAILVLKMGVKERQKRLCRRTYILSDCSRRSCRVSQTNLWYPCQWRELEILHTGMIFQKIWKMTSNTDCKTSCIDAPSRVTSRHVKS